MENKIINWADVIRFANKGNLTPDRRVEKTDDEWRNLLTEEQFYITRKKERKLVFQENIVLDMSLVFTIASVVTHLFLILPRNLTLELDGQVSPSQ